MSRLRSRTWTQRERWIMWLWKLWYVDTSGHNEKDLEWVNSEAGGHLPDLAERIMRTKGVGVGRAMSNLDPIWDAEDFGVCREIAAGQILARHPYNTMRGIIGANRLMRCCIGMFDDWQPSDSNPNILVRREE